LEPLVSTIQDYILAAVQYAGIQYWHYKYILQTLYKIIFKLLKHLQCCH
jgi:hypothetical protein